uniref:Uncharacterized protein n=1 Tax=Panagrolaimus davidi TaxID=227884 RepID=A0A914QIK7_9BILA
MPFNDQDFDKIVSNISIPKWPQKSALPADVLKYMKKNATPKQALKLMKCNKYFIQAKCPFNYLGDVGVLHKNCIELYKKIKVTKKISIGWKEIPLFEMDQLPDNLGLCGTLRVYNEVLLPEFISKIVISNLKCLYLYEQKILFDDFKFLTVELEELGLNLTAIVSNNGEIIPYQNLLDHLPSLRCLNLEYDPSNRLSKKLAERICLSNLKILTLYNLSANFKFQALLTFMAKKKPNLFIKLFFTYFYPYVGKINAYIGKLITSGIPNSCPPFFQMEHYYEENYRKCLNKKRLIALDKLRNEYHQRNMVSNI